MLQVSDVADAEFATTYPMVDVGMEALGFDTMTVSTTSSVTVGRDVANSSRFISVSISAWRRR